jgi:hypothetical protein
MKRDTSVNLSTHYYVISLSERSVELYEAFRDIIIDIRNGGFPVEVRLLEERETPTFDREQRLILAFQTVDQRFGECYRNDPLRLVVVGERDLLDLFTSITMHQDAIVGRIEGDFSDTSLRDLGKIAWSVVKEAISGLVDGAMGDLENAARARRTVCGLDAVSKLAVTGVKATLLVEEDYHMRGSISRTSQSLEISQDVDVMEEMDDTVDVVIAMVLKSGGKVILTPKGSLNSLGKIVLLLSGSEALR